MKFLLLLCLSVLSACSQFPKDADGTLPRIRQEKVFRVGIAEGHRDANFPAAAERFVAEVAKAADARPVVTQGTSEPLFLDLQAGRLDLVVAAVAPESPWADEVAVLRPFAETTADTHLLLAPVARNGENEWIMLLEEQALKVRANG